MITRPMMFSEANRGKHPPVERLPITSRTNVANVGSAFKDTRKVKVLSPHETIKKKSMFRAKALRREVSSDLLN